MLFNSQQFLIFFAIVYTLYLLARERAAEHHNSGRQLRFLRLGSSQISLPRRQSRMAITIPVLPRFWERRSAVKSATVLEQRMPILFHARVRRRPPGAGGSVIS